MYTRDGHVVGPHSKGQCGRCVHVGLFSECERVGVCLCVFEGAEEQ